MCVNTGQENLSKLLSRSTFKTQPYKLQGYRIWCSSYRIPVFRELPDLTLWHEEEASPCEADVNSPSFTEISRAMTNYTCWRFALSAKECLLWIMVLQYISKASFYIYLLAQYVWIKYLTGLNRSNFINLNLCHSYQAENMDIKPAISLWKSLKFRGVPGMKLLFKYSRQPSSLIFPLIKSTQLHIHHQIRSPTQ